MMNGIIIFFRFIKNNIGKFALAILLTVFFLFVLFPFSDLNDLVSAQVSELTQNKVFLQFDNLHFNPITASVSLDKVYIETPQTEAIKVDKVTVSPSVAALIQGKPGGTLSAQGFLKGEVKFSISPSSQPSAKSDSKESIKPEKYNLDLSAQNLNLKEFKNLMSLNLPISGHLQLNTQAIADINFIEQPEGEITLIINNFELPSSSILLQDLGLVNLPEIKLGKIELKGKLLNGKLTIETGKIGTNKDEFFGDIKGDIGVVLQKDKEDQIVPLLGSYNISLDMKATNIFKERAKFFLTFLDGYKKDLPDGTQYKFKIQASALGMPPQITSLQ